MFLLALCADVATAARAVPCAESGRVRCEAVLLLLFMLFLVVVSVVYGSWLLRCVMVMVGGVWVRGRADTRTCRSEAAYYRDHDGEDDSKGKKVKQVCDDVRELCVVVKFLSTTRHRRKMKEEVGDYSLESHFTFLLSFREAWEIEVEIGM